LQDLWWHKMVLRIFSRKPSEQF